MNVLIAPDKFKGTLSALAAARALKSGWLAKRPRDRVRLQPICDGGDGFGAAMSDLMGARARNIFTVDAAGRRIRARWWWVEARRTAIIESARVIGLAMLPPGEFHPFELDTFGLGVVVAAALRLEASRVVIGLGGSATNDGGFGMAKALGWKFFDRDDKAICKWTDLGRLRRLVPPSAVRCEVTAAVDVQNPLLGRRGATRVYGPQKGMRPQDFAVADKCLGKLAYLFRRQFGRDSALVPGAGAAGGLGFGVMAFLNAHQAPGFELFAKEAGLETALEWADIVLTGEGKLDGSSLMGKGVGQLAARCLRLRKPCLAFAGSAVSIGSSELFSKTYELASATSSADAFARPAFWLRRLAIEAAEQA